MCVRIQCSEVQLRCFVVGLWQCVKEEPLTERHKYANPILFGPAAYGHQGQANNVCCAAGWSAGAPPICAAQREGLAGVLCAHCRCRRLLPCGQGAPHTTSPFSQRLQSIYAPDNPASTFQGALLSFVNLCCPVSVLHYSCKSWGAPSLLSTSHSVTLITSYCADPL